MVSLDPPTIWAAIYAVMMIFVFSELVAHAMNRTWTAWCLNMVFFCFISYDFYVVSFDKGPTLIVMLAEYVSGFVTGVYYV